MELKELEARMNAFVESKGWYNENTKKIQTVKNLAISLSIEASEVLEHFQWHDESKDKEALALELADVALYLMQIAYMSDIDLEKAILDKLAINETREWKEP